MTLKFIRQHDQETPRPFLLVERPVTYLHRWATQRAGKPNASKIDKFIWWNITSPVFKRVVKPSKFSTRAWLVWCKMYWLVYKTIWWFKNLPCTAGLHAWGVDIKLDGHNYFFANACRLCPIHKGEKNDDQ